MDRIPQESYITIAVAQVKARVISSAEGSCVNNFKTLLRSAITLLISRFFSSAVRTDQPRRVKSVATLAVEGILLG